MPRARKPLLSVAQVFTKCQEGVSGHSKYAKILWDVHEANAEQCWKDLCFCLHHLLALPEVGQSRQVFFHNTKLEWCPRVLLHRTDC